MVLRLPVGQEAMHVEYDDDHNHETGTAAAMAESMLLRRVTRYINEKVSDGFDWASFRKLLRLDGKMLKVVSSR